MAEEERLIEEAKRSREETRRFREETEGDDEKRDVEEPSPGEPRAKTSSGDADQITDDE